MSTTLHTFAEILGSEVESADGMLKINKISIPIIQRDYAQGRKTADIVRVRNRFLDSLHDALDEDPITLDFVYGDIDDKGVLTPLDGQQRLTTLFLLHWYAAKKEGVAEDEYAFLKDFSYETRYSAREFCEELVSFTPSFDVKVSEEIVDQAWFPLEWKKDPTISSMLVMIDAIVGKFADMSGIWEKLLNGAISFYFLPIKDMGLTDELYIKMNSRGKPLTQFEHFKAELERNLKEINPERAKVIMSKIDINWTDMLWMYRGDDNVIDDEFLRYFKFICDIICYHEGSSPQGRSYDEFFLLNKYFSKDVENIESHIDTLEQYFDCWCSLENGLTPKSFLEQFISNNHEPGKIQFRGDIDIFADCLNSFAESTGRNRRFPLNRVVILYAIISYLLHKEEKGISCEQFARRLRIVNNLVRNSEDEVSDSELRSSGNRLPAILNQVDSIIIDGNVDKAIDKSFNVAQLEEEAEKYVWVDEHPDLAEKLYELEDHQLLFGQVGIIGLDNIDYADRFTELFTCDLDLVDTALMSFGNYSQRERNNWRYQFGTSNTRVQKAWQDLFHKSANYEYDRTKDTLKRLLESSESFSNDILKKVVSDYLAACEEKKEFDIRYYYVKYRNFRPCSYGKYYWKDFSNHPYRLLVMQTGQQISQNSYQPFLHAVDHSEALSKDNYGDRIIRDDLYIVCDDSAYVVKKVEDQTEVERLDILQNENGVDIEDRIQKFKKYYTERFN